MASRRFRPGAGQVSASTLRRFSVSSALMPTALRACAKAAPSPRQASARPERRRPSARKQAMTDIVTERSNGILRVQFNRPEKKNAMTNGMYVQLADIFNEAGEDEEIRVVLWHGAGDSFTAGNDIADFLKGAEPGET